MECDPILQLALIVPDTAAINEDDGDHTDIDDDVETAVDYNEDLGGVEEDFDRNDGNIFEEEESLMSQQMPFVQPIFENLPDAYDVDADSAPLSDWYCPTQSDRDDAQFDRGMLFTDKSAVKTAVQEWSIKHNWQYRVSHGNNNSNVWEVYCMNRDDQNCGWRLRASRKPKKNDMWEIVRYAGPHSCMFTTTHADHPNMTCGLISKAIGHLVAVDPSIKVGMLVAEIEQQYQIKISYGKAWYAKQKAVADVFGDWEESYAKLPQLMKALKDRNPGTLVSMNSEPAGDKQVFKRLFWAFGPSLEGFKMCRPVLSIDATFLYGKYAGKLLVALGVDANGKIFPLAFGLVHSESKADWG